MSKEWAKIRRLEQKLGFANKAQQEMQGKINDQKMRIEAALNKASVMEEEKRQATFQYDLKNKRGLTS
jgi:dsDNA-binding SOS-regulon protein